MNLKIDVIALSIGIFIALFVAVMSFFHLEPGFWDLLIGLQASFFLTLGLFIYFLLNYKKKMEITYTGVFLFFILILMVLQPVFSKISYPDGLIFPIAILILLIALNIALTSCRNIKKELTIFLFLSILVVSFFVCISMYIQLFNFNIPFIMPISGGRRIISNLAQPNQAACFVALGVCSLLFFKNRLGNLSFYLLLFVFSIFLAISGSRFSIILILLIVLYDLLFMNNNSFKEKLYNAFFFCLFSSFGFYIGYLLFLNYVTDASILERGIIDESSNIRFMMQKVALGIFQENLLFGVGWGNFFYESMLFANEINWFTFSDHTHFLFTQIAVEFGLLGLIPAIFFMIYILINFFKMEHNNVNKYLFLIVVIIGGYSLSEFPLWYLRFLIVFVFALTFLDIRSFTINIKFNFILIFTMFAIFLGSIFYAKNYMKYNEVEMMIQKGETVSISNLEPVFGFSDFREFFIYRQLELNQDELEEKIALGKRVITSYPFPYVIYKQAVYEALAGNSEQAVEYFKTLCKSRDQEYCKQLPNDLVYLKEKYPQKFNTIYNQLVIK